MLKEYVVTFGVDLSPDKLKRIEQEVNIPADVGNVYFNAKSPRHAMKLFKKQYGLKRLVIPTKNILKSVYVVRPAPLGPYMLFRVPGLKWGKDYTYLSNTLFMSKH